MTVWAVILAAGNGDRFGAPKQFLRIAGMSLVEWSVQAARPAVDGVAVVAPLGCPTADVTVWGGNSRAQSVRNGLAALPEDCDIVVVHDAARPAASTSLFVAVVRAVQSGAFCAVPVVPVVDSLRGEDAVPVSRDGLVRVQTPQAFRAGVLRQAHNGDPEATDDASLVHPRRVCYVAGDPGNVKLTHPGDLAVLDALLSGSRVPDPVGVRM